MVLPTPLLIELQGIVQVFLSLFAGSCIGWEREVAGKEAGIRTFSFICGASCSLSVLSRFYDPDSGARIVAHIILGVGFMAGGAIFRARGVDSQDFGTHGLTTAAALLVTACVGMMIGGSLYFLAIALTGFTVLALQLPKTTIWKYFSKKK